jgi:hypothetical protein
VAARLQDRSDANVVAGVLWGGAHVVIASRIRHIAEPR